MQFKSDSLQGTLDVAAQVALKLKAGDVVALMGDLGAGKTTFTQAILENLGVDQRVISPTFVINRIYQAKDYPVSHYDLYRLKDPNDVVQIGLFDEIEIKDKLIIIEWPEIIRSLLPEHTIWVKIDVISDTGRLIQIN